MKQHSTTSLLIAATLCLASRSARAEPPLRIKVLTYNCWGIPVVTPSRVERMSKIGPAVAALHPDLVALEEVWMDEDADRLTADLQAAGLKHVRRFPSYWPGGSGLLIASVFPIRDAAFKAYTLGTKLRRPWHLEYAAGKGLALIRVQTPLGPLDFAGTHMQAGYETDAYLPTQISQTIEATDLVGALGVAGYGEPQGGHPPLILAGDLNARWFELPIGLLEARGALTPAAPEQGEDSVLFRPGSEVEVRTVDLREVLTGPVELDDGTSQQLSDHPGILAELELRRQDSCLAAAPPVDSQAVAVKALTLVRSDLDYWHQADLLTRFGGVVMLCVAFRLWVLRRRHASGSVLRSRALIGMALVMGSLAGLALHVGMIYGPDQLNGLEIAAVKLERMAGLERVAGAEPGRVPGAITGGVVTAAAQ